MKILNIRFANPLDDIDIENENVDVFVDTEDGYTYTLSFATTKNTDFLMDKEKMNFFGPGYPFIYVKKLTRENIEEAIRAYAEDDGYWLKVYHFAGCSGMMDESIFDQLKAKHIKEEEEFDKLVKFNELQNEYNKFRKKLIELKEVNELDGLNDEYLKFKKKLEEFDEFY